LEEEMKKRKEETDEEMIDVSTMSSTSNSKPLSQETEILTEEFEALLKRNVVVRRGRNNRIFYKFIKKEIFEDEKNDDDTSEDEF
jgi:hypothetical protein